MTREHTYLYPIHLCQKCVCTCDKITYISIPYKSMPKVCLSPNCTYDRMFSMIWYRSSCWVQAAFNYIIFFLVSHVERKPNANNCSKSKFELYSLKIYRSLFKRVLSFTVFLIPILIFPPSISKIIALHNLTTKRPSSVVMHSAAPTVERRWPRQNGRHFQTTFSNGISWMKMYEFQLFFF